MTRPSLVGRQLKAIAVLAKLLLLLLLLLILVARCACSTSKHTSGSQQGILKKGCPLPLLSQGPRQSKGELMVATPLCNWRETQTPL
jgi:hypothetical protein